MTEATATEVSPLGKLAATWGVVGVLLLLGQAILRLGPRAVEAVSQGLSTTQWLLLGVWIAVSAHGEGYRAFHLRFSPRVVVRARHLATHPRALHVALAPLFCMSLFHASRRGKIVAWSITAMVIGFIVLLRHTPQPWRGIVDGGVVVALVMGAVSIVYHALRALGGSPPDVPSQLPTQLPTR